LKNLIYLNFKEDLSKKENRDILMLKKYIIQLKPFFFGLFTQIGITLSHYSACNTLICLKEKYQKIT